MQVTQTSTDGLKREYSIVVPAADIDQRLNGKLHALSHQVKMPGFRPGKVPVTLLKKIHGQKVMGEVLEETVNASSQQLIQEKELRPALQPQIEITKFEDGGDLEFAMTVEILPDIPEADFSSIKLERLVSEVAEETVDGTLQNLANQQKNFVATEPGSKAVLGNAVVMDFDGRIDGEAFDGCTGQG